MNQKLQSLLFILLVASCNQSSTITESEKAKIIAEVRSTLDQYYNDIRKSGLTAEFQYLDNTKEFYWTPPGYPQSISYDSVAAILSQNSSKYKLIDNSFDTLRIIPLNEEYATYTGRLRSTMTDTAGIVTTFSLVETGVLVKRKDRWKLLSGQTSIVD